MIGSSITRPLTEIELIYFNTESSLSTYDVTIGFLLVKDKFKNGSVSYKYLKSIKLKKCNYFVKYKNENSFAYGLIDYYIKLSIIYMRQLSNSINQRRF